MRARRKRTRLADAIETARIVKRSKKPAEIDILNIYPHLRPYYMSSAARILYALIALALILYSLYCISVGYIVLFGKRQSMLVVVGVTMWIYISAMLACSSYLTASIVAHYRPSKYCSLVMKIGGRAGWLFFILGFFVMLAMSEDAIVYLR